MYPGTHARSTPDKPALICAATGAVTTYRELDERSNRLAQLLHARGLRRGDHVAIFMDNNPRYVEVLWAALRSGLYLTPINRFLTAEEVAYIVEDCDAKALFSSFALRAVAQDLIERIPYCPLRLMVDGAIPGWTAYEPAVAAQSAQPLAAQPGQPLSGESAGQFMYYSSGTTGRPKGILAPLREAHASEPAPVTLAHIELNRFTPDTVYLSPAPLYHSAPIAYVTAVQVIGGTVVMMEKFDPLEALALVERHRVTHAQWVPTMFVRLLRLPEADRQRYDLSSMQLALHAAAPCPVEVKRRMIEWWGPIVEEYYASSEGVGATRINSAEWLAHPGSVGRATRGIIRVCGEDGEELPVGETGTVYFEPTPGMAPFEYHKDRAKSESIRNPRHPDWLTVGDIGRLDAEGYLYLTDRLSDMILVGGANIYPAEVEAAIDAFPGVRSSAVIGLPDEDMGARLYAVVDRPEGPADPKAMEAHLAERLVRYKIPKSFEYVSEPVRDDAGKVRRKTLRDERVAAAKQTA